MWQLWQCRSSYIWGGKLVHNDKLTVLEGVTDHANHVLCASAQDLDQHIFVCSGTARGFVTALRQELVVVLQEPQQYGFQITGQLSFQIFLEILGASKAGLKWDPIPHICRIIFETIIITNLCYSMYLHTCCEGQYINLYLLVQVLFFASDVTYWKNETW